MNIEIKFHVKKDFIHCIALGFDGSDNTYLIWSEISKQIKKHKISKILLNSYLKGSLDQDYRKQLHEIFQELDIDLSCKIAVVNLNTETMEDFKLGEKILRDNGYQISLFNNQEAAITWLLNY